jgi:hypothetical protein
LWLFLLCFARKTAHKGFESFWTGKHYTLNAWSH